jgi:hypothetical protein
MKEWIIFKAWDLLGRLILWLGKDTGYDTDQEGPGWY